MPKCGAYIGCHCSIIEATCFCYLFPKLKHFISMFLRRTFILIMSGPTALSYWFGEDNMNEAMSGESAEFYKTVCCFSQALNVFANHNCKADDNSYICCMVFLY